VHFSAGKQTYIVCKVRGLTLLLRVELCGGEVTVSFSKYIPWQAMNLGIERIHVI